FVTCRRPTCYKLAPTILLGPILAGTITGALLRFRRGANPGASRPGIESFPSGFIRKAVSTRENKTMATVTKRLGVAVLAGVAGCLLAANPVLAQPAMGQPGMGARPNAPLLNGFNAQAQGLGFGGNFQPAFMTSVSTPYAAFTGTSPGGSFVGLPPVTAVPSNVNSSNLYPSNYGG